MGKKNKKKDTPPAATEQTEEVKTEEPVTAPV